MNGHALALPPPNVQSFIRFMRSSKLGPVGIEGTEFASQPRYSLGSPDICDLFELGAMSF